AESTGDDFAEVLPDLLSRMELPPARPFAAGDSTFDPVATVKATPALADPGELVSDENVARALVIGGEAAVSDPHDPGLPALWGRLLSWLPQGERVRPRAGILGSRAVAPALPEPARNLYHYLHRSFSTGGRRAWRLVLDLCTTERVDLHTLF